MDYGEDFVKVRYPLDLRVSKEEELETDGLEEEEKDTYPADEEVNDTDTDHQESMSG